LRNAVRLFHASPLVVARELDSPCSPEKFQDIDADELLDRAFAIFKGKRAEWGKNLFAGSAAALVWNQRWHKDQMLEETEEGVILRIPAEGFTKMKILQFGARARVLLPPPPKGTVSQERQKVSRRLSPSSDQDLCEASPLSGGEENR